MFGYIKGEVTEIALDHVIIETGGVGFQLITSQFTNEQLYIGQQAKLLTKLNVREDDISLFGFHDREEMQMFEMLTTVSKIGPKVGFSILSTYNTQNLRSIIAHGDVAQLSKASGVGKRTAERIIVELKDKVGSVSAPQMIAATPIPSNMNEEALAVLTSLGFSKAEALDAMSRAIEAHNPQNTNDLVKRSLANLSKL